MMKSILKLVMIGLMSIVLLSCGTIKQEPRETVKVKVLLSNGETETGVYEIPVDNFVTIKRDERKSWLVYKVENGIPTMLKKRVTHILNIEYIKV